MRFTTGISNLNSASINTANFFVDLNKDGDFNDAGENIGSTWWQRIGSIDYWYRDYDPRNLASGVYDTKVTAIDSNGISQEAFNTLTITPWNTSGMDSIDSDYYWGNSNNSNVSNTIVQGSTGIRFTSAIYDPANTVGNVGFTSYTFHIDTNRDGDFLDSGETINANYNTYSSGYNYFYYDYNPASLGSGAYNTKFTITDKTGLTQETTDTFRITPWNIAGMDSIDSDYYWGNSNNSNVSNTITQGTTGIRLTAAIYDPANTVGNTGFTSYTFQIDTNRDGDFLDSGEIVNAVYYTSSGGYNYFYYDYNPASLGSGAYNTKFTITDKTGLSQEAYDVLTIGSTPVVQTWTALGLDSIDSDKIYGGTDSNTTNTILQGIQFINLAAGVDNSGLAKLSYKFEIDSNNDGDYLDAGETIITQTTNSSNGTNAIYDVSGLSAGTYNTRVSITDTNNLSSIQTNSFAITAPTIIGLDSIDSDKIYGGNDSNTTNTINQGTQFINLAAGIDNTGLAKLTYKFEIDANRDGDFLDAGETIITQTTNSNVGTNAIYDVSGLSAGTYNTKVTITDSNTLSSIQTSSFTITAPTVVGMDAIDNDKSFGGSDSHSTNTISLNTNGVYMTAGVNNPGGTNLKYTFAVDLNKDGDFLDAGEIIGTISSTGSSNSMWLNTFSLASGSYNTQVSVVDLNNIAIGTSTSSFTVSPKASWDLKGLDAIDSDGSFQGTDSNATNTINQSTNYINLTAGVENVDRQALNYTFYVDTNRDGDFVDSGETIGTILNSTATSAAMSYSPQLLSPGTYSTKVVVKDANNLTRESIDTFTVQANNFNITGLDSSDADLIYGGTDTNPTNIIGQGSRSTVMTAGIDNSSKQILSYQFQIDSNNDGIFENIGSTVKSTNTTGAYTTYDPVNLAAGTYNTKVILTDINGLQKTAFDTFTVSNGNIPWNIKEIDSVDSDAIYGGTDSNTTNTIGVGTQFVTMTAGVYNPYSQALVYTFQIDSNNDGVFETYRVSSSNTDSAYAIYDARNLAAGSYNTKVQIADAFGNNKQESFSSLVVSNGSSTSSAWSAMGLDSIDSDGVFGGTDSNSLNSIYQGVSSIRMSAGVENPYKLPLNYRFQADLDNNGSFEDIQTISSVNIYGAYIDLRTIDLNPGSYNTKVIVSDQNGTSYTVNNNFTVQAKPWSITGLDSIDSDGIFGGTDSNSINTTVTGTSQITMAVGVTNAQNSLLNYKFQIDSDRNGVFEDIISASSTVSSGVSANYSTLNLGDGIYNTKAIVTDNLGTTSYITDSFTLTTPSITTSSSSENLIGTAGNNTYIFLNSFGQDRIVDNGGLDTLDLSSLTANSTIDLRSSLSASEVINGTNTINWAGNAIENIISGSGDDLVVGNDSDNILSTGAGNDTLTGGLGNDILLGGADNDIYQNFLGNFGTDIINDASGSNDTLDLQTSSFSDVASWLGLDTNSDGNVDQLMINFNNGSSIAINKYFDNSNTDPHLAIDGSGHIENILFGDHAPLHLLDVQALIV
jgi:hypothetical protein